MNKLYASLFLFVLVLVSFAGAQASVEDQFKGAVGSLEGNVSKVKEFTEINKSDFIASQWKEFLLKNKAIAGVDAFFTKLNFVFVALFSHDWEMSLEMLFVFLLWVFTLLSLYLYFFSAKDNNLRWGYSVGGAIAIAWLQLFNKLSIALVNFVLLSPKSLFRIISVFLIIVLLLFIYRILNFFAKKMEAYKLKRKEHMREVRDNKMKGFFSGFEDAAKG